MSKKKNKKNLNTSASHKCNNVCCCATMGKKAIDTQVKTLSDYQDEHITLLDMARCSSRYLSSKERDCLGDAQIVDNQNTILRIWDLYHQYSERLRKECLEATGLPLEP